MEDLLGILINKGHLKKYIHKRTSEESLELYQKYGDNLGIRVGFLTVSGIDLQEQKAKMYFFDKGKELVSQMVPIPKFIHNRAIHTKMDDIRLVRKLRGSGKSILYNPVCSYKWSNVCRILKIDPEIASYIPAFNKCSVQELEQLISGSFELLLESASSKKKGIVEVSKSNGLLEYRWYKNGRIECGILPQAESHIELSKMLDTDGFIVQEKVLFDQYRGKPYLLQLSIQKDGSGEWNLSGMIARVYHPAYFPLKKKMECVPIETIREQGHLQLDSLAKIARRSAEVLERFIPHLSDLCINFCQSPDGSIRLVDASLLDKRIWYKEAGEIAMWEATYRKPIEYGAYLLNQLAGRETCDFSHLSC